MVLFPPAITQGALRGAPGLGNRGGPRAPATLKATSSGSVADGGPSYLKCIFRASCSCRVSPMSSHAFTNCISLNVGSCKGDDAVNVIGHAYGDACGRMRGRDMQRQCPVSQMYIYMEGSGKLEALNTDSIVRPHSRRESRRESHPVTTHRSDHSEVVNRV